MGTHTGETWEPAPNLYVLERYDDAGWGWNVVALRLEDGGLLLYSPSWLGKDTFERIDRLGPVRALLVPSHFHHLALKRFQERYPEARAFASSAAMPRLIAQGEKGLSP